MWREVVRRRVAEADARKADVDDGRRLRARHVDEDVVAALDDRDDGAVRRRGARRVVPEVELLRRRVVEPLGGRVELIEDVLDHELLACRGRGGCGQRARPLPENLLSSPALPPREPWLPPTVVEKLNVVWLFDTLNAAPVTAAGRMDSMRHHTALAPPARPHPQRPRRTSGRRATSGRPSGTRRPRRACAGASCRRSRPSCRRVPGRGLREGAGRR